MKDYLLFLVLGTGTGAVYGAIGLGLVLAYRASGVVNLAHGAMAMWGAYVFSELRSSGDLVVPVVGVPARLHLAERPSLALALSLSLGAAGLLGLLVYAVVFRPLRSSPPLAGVVASVGLTVALQAVAVLQFGPSNRFVPAVLPAHPVTVGGVTLPSDRLELAALVAAGAGLLWAITRFTRVGLAARAAAEDELGAMVTGWSPDALAAGTWVLAGVVGALGAILAGPITQLNPVTSTLLVVPALAAALVGRLSSFGVTAAAGLALGMAQSEIVVLQDRFPWLPRLGLGAGLPLLVIVVALAFGGRRAPQRGTPGTGRLPAAGWPRRVLPTATTMVVLGAGALVVLPGRYRLGLVTSMIAAVVCLSLVVLTGYAGQISLAQMAFAGIAGFSLSRLASGLGVPFPLAPLLAAGLAGLVGLALGVPALRVRGLNLALVTVAGAVAVEELVFKSTALAGGFLGHRVPPPALFGVDLGIGRASPGEGHYPRPVFGLLVLAALGATAVSVAHLRRGRVGRRLLAVRANEAAAAALGVDVAAAKLTAFTTSAFIAGIAGALVGYQEGQLSAESFGVFVSLSYLGIAYLGGITSISGALVGGALAAGGIVFTALDQVGTLGRYQLLLSGVGLVAVVVLAPEGIAGAGRRLLGRRKVAGDNAAGRDGAQGQDGLQTRASGEVP